MSKETVQSEQLETINPDKKKSKTGRRIGGAALVGLMAATGVVAAVRNNSDSKVSARPAPSTTEKLGASSTTQPEKTRVLSQGTINQVANWEVAGDIPEKREVRHAIRLLAELEDQSYFDMLKELNPGFIRIRLGASVTPNTNEIRISDKEVHPYENQKKGLNKEQVKEIERLELISLAGDIGHELFQLKWNKDWQKEHPGKRVPDSVWKGGDVLGGPKGNNPDDMMGPENVATRMQIDLLTKLGATNAMIVERKSLIGSGYWNVENTQENPRPW